MLNQLDGPRRGERIARVVLVVFAVLLTAAIVGRFIKVEYVVVSPGPAINTLGERDAGSPVVRVKGAKTYKTDSELYFTTVNVLGGPGRRISVWEWGSGVLDPDARVVPEGEVFRGDGSGENVDAVNAELMQASEETAAAVALRSLGKDVPRENVVTKVIKGMPADGTLHSQDVILSIDGARPGSRQDLAAAIGDLKVGEEVRIVVRRDGHEKTVTLEATGIGGGKTGIGAGIESEYNYPFEVSIDAGKVGGPSAGMMLALAVRDRLTPGVMAGGESIAGTGTISDSGKVGPIGGIQMKMVGAQEAGAEWFLAPQANCSDVVGNVPEGLKVVTVADYHDAVSAVDSIAEGETDALSSCEDMG
mgnify:CR=1 FL=1